MHGASIGNRTLWGHRLASTYAEFEAVAHRPSGGDGGEGGGDDSQSRQGQADPSPPPQVSLDGFRQALRQLDIPLTQAQAAEIFAAMDLDQDGWLECAHRACLLSLFFGFRAGANAARSAAGSCRSCWPTNRSPTAALALPELLPVGGASRTTTAVSDRSLPTPACCLLSTCWRRYEEFAQELHLRHVHADHAATTVCPAPPASVRNLVIRTEAVAEITLR
jgi:hypothetical protein